MIQYLIILLDDTSASYCHYANSRMERRLIPVETLKAGILFGMKENLNIQFVYPDYELPQEYKDVIETIDHTNIAPCTGVTGEEADVLVIDGIAAFSEVSFDETKAYVLRTDRKELFSDYPVIGDILERVARLNVVITDVCKFDDADFERYKSLLSELVAKVENLAVEGKFPQLNLLTDRMLLSQMNNCGAGDTSITLAPDGHFYVCPAFYCSEDGYAVGDINSGLDIKNPQLYRLSHAPLCRNCDAYQCRRCVWLNRKTALEVNTPSHEQCVTAHLERNASRSLLAAIRQHGDFLADKEIKEISYLDPFDVRKEW